MTKKMVDGVVMDMTPEEQAAFDAREATPVVGTETLDMGPSMREQLGAKNVKS